MLKKPEWVRRPVCKKGLLQGIRLGSKKLEWKSRPEMRGTKWGRRPGRKGRTEWGRRLKRERTTEWGFEWGLVCGRRPR